MKIKFKLIATNTPAVKMLVYHDRAALVINQLRIKFNHNFNSNKVFLSKALAMNQSRNKFKLTKLKNKV